MRKLATILGLLALAITLSSVTASAQTQIVIGGLGTTLDFSGTAGGNASLTFGACPSIGSCTLDANSFFEIGGVPDGGTDVATLSFTVGAFNLSSSNGFVWSVVTAPAMTFTFSDAVAGSISGTINWSEVNTDGTVTLVGGLTVSSVSDGSGSKGLADFFTVGQAYHVDYTSAYSTSAHLSDIFNSGGTASANASSGEVVVPEPSTLLLLGTGLLGLGGAIRRRFLAV